MTSKISSTQLSITTKNTIVLDGVYTDWHIRQEKERTVVWRHETWNANSPIIELSMPRTRYSTAHDAPACGNGRVEFYNDLKAAIANKKASA